MAKLNYDEISEMFPKLYYSSEYWYQKAWEIISKFKLNEYNNSEEKFKVYLHIATLGMIYIDFFNKIYDDENDYEEFINDFKSKIKKEFKDEEVITIIKPYNIDLPSEEYEDDEEIELELDFDDYEAILLVLGKERSNIIEVLEKDMDKLKICTAIYCSAKSMDDIDYSDDENDENENDFDEERYLNSLLSTKDYESFWTSMNNNFQEIYDNLVSSDFSSAYEWWKNGAYQLG